MNKYVVRNKLGKLIIHLLLMAGAITMLIPFLWMVRSSVMTSAEMFYYPPKWVPTKFLWSNYKEVVDFMPFGMFTLNSAYTSLLGTFGMLLTCCIAAYTFARMRFPGRDFIFAVLLACMMIPGQVTMIPTFLIMRKFGWMNTHLPLIIPNFFGGAFGIFMLRQFLATIPRDMDDAARIDGCGRLRTLFQILLPLLKPALATLAIFTFMGKWNDLLGPVLYLNDLDKMTLTVGLTMLQGQYGSKYNLIMCGAVISMLPVLVLYAFCQKYFVQGIVMSGIKG